jgi:putative heme-binding domain-containing protein
MNALPIIALSSLLVLGLPENETAPRVLVFSKTVGFRHADAIVAGIAAVRELGAQAGFAVDDTDDAAAFTASNLSRYRALVFLNTSGTVLDERQEEEGRVWCTALGHTKESYSESMLRKHLLGGIQYAAGLPARATPAKTGSRGAGPSREAAIRRVRSSSAGRLDEPAVPADRGKYIRYAHEHAGDAARGRALFFDHTRAACARCHRAKGEGGDIGPDLSDIGGKYERALLIESLLDPSRQIVEGYRPTMLTTTSGRILSGIVKAESASEVTLVDAEGKRQVVTKAEISERTLIATSLMPDGVAAGLSPEQFADVVAYLESLRSAGQGTPGSDIRGPITLSPGFCSEWVATGITGATALAIAPDGRAFICEQTGSLRVFKNGKLLPAPFVTVDVDSSWERGLIGIALDPHFSDSRHIFLCYVALRPYVHHRISRFTAHRDVAAPGSEVVLFEGDDQAKLGGSVSAGHQGGAIHFGRDGKLYAAIGDHTAGAPAQSLSTLQGKLLRLNADGSIPEDNPFYRKTTGKYRSIWALGLRNPFTFAVEPGTGRMILNDVGETKWEEVNEGFAGANYGWPESEGPTSDPRFRGPIHHYPSASVAGGVFCTPAGSAGFPPHFHGKYFFMDFVGGWIKLLDPNQPEKVETFATGLSRPVDLAFGPDGALFVLLRDAWVIDGNFHRRTGSLLKIHAELPNLPKAQSKSVRASAAHASGLRSAATGEK